MAVHRLRGTAGIREQDQDIEILDDDGDDDGIDEESVESNSEAYRYLTDSSADDYECNGSYNHCESDIRLMTSDADVARTGDTSFSLVSLDTSPRRVGCHNVGFDVTDGGESEEGITRNGKISIWQEQSNSVLRNKGNCCNLDENGDLNETDLISDIDLPCYSEVASNVTVKKSSDTGRSVSLKICRAAAVWKTLSRQEEHIDGGCLSRLKG